jgi:DNA repair photolyase
VGDVFAGWLERHFPERKEKVLSRIRDSHAGRLNDTRFKTRMIGDGEMAAALRTLFHVTTRKLGIAHQPPKLSTEHFRRPGETRSLFG